MLEATTFTPEEATEYRIEQVACLLGIIESRRSRNGTEAIKSIRASLTQKDEAKKYELIGRVYEFVKSAFTFSSDDKLPAGSTNWERNFLYLTAYYGLIPIVYQPETYTTLGNSPITIGDTTYDTLTGGRVSQLIAKGIRRLDVYARYENPEQWENLILDIAQ